MWPSVIHTTLSCPSTSPICLSSRRTCTRFGPSSLHSSLATFHKWLPNCMALIYALGTRLLTGCCSRLEVDDPEYGLDPSLDLPDVPRGGLALPTGISYWGVNRCATYPFDHLTTPSGSHSALATTLPVSCGFEVRVVPPSFSIVELASSRTKALSSFEWWDL